jgi:hypothetical protein
VTKEEIIAKYGYGVCDGFGDHCIGRCQCSLDCGATPIPMNDISEGDKMNVPARTVARGDVIESVIAKGDLSKLTELQRTQYYVQLCQSMGLNPHTQPFAYITLNGKLTLYAKRDAADQLRKINGISIEVISRNIEDGLFTVHVRATDRSNRTDEDFGVVALPDTLKGEARANTILKGITKAKRRVTLSISGLGFLDETEVEDIPKHQTAKARIQAIAELPEAEREAASAHMHEQDAERMAENFSNAMSARPEHDENGEIWEEDGVRPATAEDRAEFSGLSKAQFLATTREHIRVAADWRALGTWWNSDEQKQARQDFELTRNEAASIRDFCEARLKALKEAKT